MTMNSKVRVIPSAIRKGFVKGTFTQKMKAPDKLNNFTFSFVLSKPQQLLQLRPVALF